MPDQQQPPDPTILTDGIHLVSQDPDALHRFASLIGLKREWFQEHPRHPHYDTITLRKLRLALDAGAVLVTPRYIATMSIKGMLVGGRDWNPEIPLPDRAAEESRALALLSAGELGPGTLAPYRRRFQEAAACSGG